MRKLRLIRPWRLQTRRQRTGYDRPELMDNTAKIVSCQGPQGDEWLGALVNNPRTASCNKKHIIGPPATSFNRMTDRSPEA